MKKHTRLRGFMIFALAIFCFILAGCSTDGGNKPLSESEPAGGREPVSEREKIGESERISEGEQVSESEPAGESEQVSESEKEGITALEGEREADKETETKNNISNSKINDNKEDNEMTGHIEFETAVQAVNNITAGWNLGNTLDATGDWIAKGSYVNFETAWGNPVTTKEMITKVKGAGFNAIRVPVTWEFHMDADGNVDREWMDRVQEVVDYVISQDLYCILNMHHDGGAGTQSWVRASAKNYNKNKDRFARVWEQIAERFMDYPEKLLFEAINEPLDEAGNWGNGTSDANLGLAMYHQTFVNTVRNSGGNNKFRNLIVMTYAGSHDKEALEQFILPKDKVVGHLILEVHSYDPVGFSWYEASWTTVRSTWGTEADYKEIDEDMLMLKNYSEELGVPVIIGEFGSEDKDNDSERAKHASHFVTAAAKYGIKCFWWDCGRFALLDRRKVEIIHSEVVEAIINAAQGKLTK